MMRLLAEADLVGLDPTAEDVDGWRPNDFFVQLRDENCSIPRQPFEEEEQAWYALLRSACRQNNIEFASLGITAADTEDLDGDGDQPTSPSTDEFVDALEEIRA